ncbi:Stk1 family PASTA domain-containing Ser/Thr kinase [Sinomonas flava]|uniref:Stk1 family PASTA domain-containing Ser/Thr kinase n=1 Tax=Sinomonas flava TaxID=496857 RepID=UPI0039A7565B
MNGKLSDALVGSLVGGRYRVESRLAIGGMATVYVASDTNLEREVALKVLHPHLSQDPSFAERLEHEAKAAARLSHPHVVSVLDRGHDGDVFFLVMEYVPGRNLRQLLNESGPLAPKQALALIYAVVEGLAAAHAAGLVHRDIKPENVLLGDSGQIKVADFGLARAATASTSTGLTLGTVAYIAPELVQRTGGDARSDLYSVGIMLYELLTGRQPFRGDLPDQIAYQHLTADVPPPSELVPGLSPELDELVQWAAARDPEDRPVDAEALLGEIRHIRTHLSDAQLDLRAGSTEHLPQTGSARTDVLPAARTEVIGAVSANRTTVMPHAAVPAPATPRQVRKRERDAAREAASAAATPTRTLAPGGRRRGVVWALIVIVLALVAALAGWFFGVGPGAAATVPNVKELTVAQATPLFDRAGLTFSTQDVFDDGVAAGLIVGSTPPGGTEIRRFQGVSLLVSKGPQLFPLEDLRGRSLDEAKAGIARAQMALGAVTEAYSETAAAGTVTAQDPGPGTPLRRGAAVALTVSKGPQPIPVPQVVGKSQSEALAALRAAGLDPVVSADEVNDRNIPKGAVAAQSPGAGTALTKGGKVTLTISKGPKLVRVPNYVGKQADQAADALRKLGFDVRIEKVLGGFFGTVRAQDPVDADVPEGSTVTLTVV